MNKHDLLAEFLDTWPIERLRTMALEEYTNLNKQDSFCYWLEQRTNELGGITGGSSFKFGIYKRNNTEKEISTSNDLTDGEYAWFEKYGQTRDEAFQKVRNIIVQIAEFATNKEFDKIEEIDLGESTKWKIAFMYSDFQLINTFSKDMVCSILDFLQIEYSYDESRFSLSNKILSQKNENEDYFEFGSKFWNETLISQGLKKILTKLGYRVLPYFDIMDRIVENFNLEPNNEKYYFSYNSKELIFTIGQRYIWNLTKNEYKYISLTKNEEIAETFGRKNQEPDAFLNYSKNPENFSVIFDRISLSIKNELEGTIKASHRNQNKKDLQELVFNKELRSKILYNKRRLFIQWLSKQFEEKNGTNNSYVRAIDILSELLKIDLFTISEIEYFRDLYEDLILNQKDESGKYYYEEAKSYGRDGFYSAAIQMYINFLSSDNNQLNEPIPAYTTMNTKTSLNQILYGPPGTGKTYNTVLEAAKIITDNDNISYDEALKVFNENLNNQIEFITFHQNYSYEDFIQGLRPDTENGKELSFEKKDGVFKRIADRALKNLEAVNNPSNTKKDFDIVFQELIKPLNEDDIEELEIKMKKSSFYITEVGEKSIEFRKNIGDSNHTLSINTLRKMYDKGENDIILGGLQPYYNPILELLLTKGKNHVTAVSRKNYVIIIDEINRANISRVFGELITLIEEDKRSHGKIPMRVTLPSGDSFIVPSNLYIIGTMNTADKSISLLDIALRRRFEFVPMYPDTLIQGVNSPTVLETINAEIIKRKGHDFTIGHAYFMGEEYTLVKTINNKVIPLLLEYFMNDEKEVATILKAAEIEVIGWPMKMKTQ